MHLFDVDIPGGVSFQESAIVSPGNQITVFDTQYGRMGVAICYDMRFPELMRLMVLEGAEIIVVPAAFNTTTGPAHWHETIKMRAVDNQVYFAAASPARNMDSTYHAYGFSSIVDPWGTVLASADETETMISAPIDPARQEAVRQQLPLLKHRREDVYELTRRIRG
jgi:omega-amidase